MERSFTMYLISIYFDEKTDKKIRHIMEQIAKNTGNTTLSDDHVPPHITLSAFETKDEAEAIHILETCAGSLSQGNVQWISVATFLPYVIYLAPLLDEYLFHMSKTIHDAFSKTDGISINKFYKPFSWQPHTTVGRKLSPDEMRTAFETLQKQFGPFKGTVTKIGLARTNPHRDIAVFELK